MIAIIGGGPAGIALATELDDRGLSYALYEKGRLGETWRSTPHDLRVLSPWWTNVLHRGAMLQGNPFRKPSARAYLSHLLDIAADLGGSIHQGCPVSAMRRQEEGWELTIGPSVAGPFESVVMATGYFSSPRGPSPEIPNDGTIRTLHAAEIRDYSQLDDLRQGESPVVIVGRRVTAGQLMLELTARGIPCALSTKSSLEYRRHGRVAAAREGAYFFWEALQATLKPGMRRPSYPVMEGGRTRQLIESGQVQVIPRILEVSAGSVLLEDGRRLAASALIYATGYEANTRLVPRHVPLDEYGVPVHDGFQIVGMPGLYLLGYDNLYDHRSRYLRGIRADARRLAKRLSRACGQPLRSDAM